MPRQATKRRTPKERAINRVSAYAHLALRHVMETEDASQRDVARWVFVNQSTVARWAAKKTPVDCDAVFRSKRIGPMFAACMAMFLRRAR